MLPLQIILKLFHWLRVVDGPPVDEDDPFQQPIVAQMSARQLADLPMLRPAQMTISAEDTQPLRRCA